MRQIAVVAKMAAAAKWMNRIHPIRKWSRVSPPAMK